MSLFKLNRGGSYEFVRNINEYYYYTLKILLKINIIIYGTSKNYYSRTIKRT